MEIFPHVAWHFNSFAERSRGETTVETLVRDVLDANRQCWVFIDAGVQACALTKVTGPTVEMTHCAGQGREDWQEQLVDDIRTWARDIGATRFRTINRPGWTKMLRGMGLRETHRIMEQELGHGQE